MPGREVVLIFRSLHFAQILMDELYRHRSLADSGSHALYGTMAHIAYGKNAGNIGFEQERISVGSPSLRALPVTYKVRAGQEERSEEHTSELQSPVHLVCRLLLEKKKKKKSIKA